MLNNLHAELSNTQWTNTPLVFNQTSEGKFNFLGRLSIDNKPSSNDDFTACPFTIMSKKGGLHHDIWITGTKSASVCNEFFKAVVADAAKNAPLNNKDAFGDTVVLEPKESFWSSETLLDKGDLKQIDIKVKQSLEEGNFVTCDPGYYVVERTFSKQGVVIIGTKNNKDCDKLNDPEVRAKINIARNPDYDSIFD